MTGAHRLDDARVSADTEYLPPVLFGDLLDPMSPELVAQVQDVLLTRWSELAAGPSPEQTNHGVTEYGSAYATGPDNVVEQTTGPVHDFHEVPRAERTGPLPVIPADLSVPVSRVHTVLRDSLGLDWHQSAEDPSLFDMAEAVDFGRWEFIAWTRGQLDRLRGPVRDVTGEYVRQLAEPVWPDVDRDRPRRFQLGRQDFPKMDPTRLISHVAVIVAAVWLAWGASAHIVTGWFFVAVGLLCGLEGLRLVFPTVTAGWARWGRHRAATTARYVAALWTRDRDEGQPPEGGSPAGLRSAR